MTSSHEPMTNYRECSGNGRTADGDVLPVEGVVQSYLLNVYGLLGKSDQ